MHIYYMISIKMARNELLFDRFWVEEKFHMKINLFEMIGIWNIRNLWYYGHDFGKGRNFKLCPLCLLPLIEIFICNFTTFSCRHHVAVGIFFLCRNSSFQIQITFKLFLIMHDKDSKHFVLLLQQRQKRIAWHDKLSKVFIYWKE